LGTGKVSQNPGFRNTSGKCWTSNRNQLIKVKIISYNAQRIVPWTKGS
jgi:hypothetical protein